MSILGPFENRDRDEITGSNVQVNSDIMVDSYVHGGGDVLINLSNRG